MLRNIGNYVLDIDIDATKQAFINMPPDVQCSCDGCRNYNVAMACVSDDVKAFMESLGVDIYKASELMIPFELENGLISYMGFYHICGKIISGARPDNFREVHPTEYPYDETNLIKIGDNFEVGFKNECDLLPDSFAKPCFQMDIFADLPWVIERGDDPGYYPYETEKTGLVSRIKALFKRH